MLRTSRVLLYLSLSTAAVSACAPGIVPSPPLSMVPACRTPLPAVSPIAWFDAPGGSDRTRDWCDAVGPIFRGRFATLRQAAPRSVLVVSWNIDAGAGDVQELVRALTREEREAGRGGPDFILLLQEAYRTGAAIPASIRAATAVPRRIARGARAGRDVERLAEAVGMNVFYVPSMRNGAEDPGEDRGNAILSTLPLENETAIELPFEHQRRVAVGATVRVGGTPVFVTSVHLDTRRPWFRGSVFAGPAARHRQARALLEALAAAPADVPAIVAGDFNTLGGAREPAIAAVERRFPLVSCGNTRTHAWKLQLDYVFASDSALVAACQRRDDRLGSDHHPLVARLGTSGPRAVRSAGL